MKKLLLSFIIVLLPCIVLAQESIEITGSVAENDTSMPIPGVNILEKGTNNGTMTDFDGNYTIKVPENAILVVSYIGYATKEIKANGRSEINIILEKDAAALDEIIVIGYGTQKKENLTGSVSQIDSDALADRPVSNVTNALQGTMPGVTVSAASSGQPGRDGGSINVRGIGTLNNSSAMVVVDGVISSMNNVNPDDIQSISVLKDAASAAIYGSRAANGVILITTKKGKKGDVKVNLKSYVGKTDPTYLPDFLPSWQAAELYNQGLVNEGKPVLYTPEEINKFRSGSDPYNYPNTDWLDLFYRGKGIQQNYYSQVTGGTEKTQYSFSLGAFDQDGLVERTGSERYTFRSNINTSISDRLSASSNIAFTNSIIDEPSNPYTDDFEEIVRQINRIRPTIPYKFENGNYGSNSDGSPMAWLEGDSFNKEKYYDLVGNIGVDWEPLDGLHFKPSLAYVLKMVDTKRFIADIQYYDAEGEPTFYQGPNSVTDGNSIETVLTNQYILNYEKSFGDHSFDLLLGYSQELTKYNFNEGFRKNLLNNRLYEIDLGSSQGQVASGYSNEMALQSYFGRLKYDYKSRYLVEANLRRDGSSRFSEENRWGVFPSFSAAWNIDKEDFFEPIAEVVNTLKIRGSWGTLGNQKVTSRYPYIPSIRSGLDYTFGGAIASGVAPVDGVNSDIKWETTEMTTIAFDATFLERRLSLSVDYFYKLTSDILLAVPVGGVYGLSAPVQNAGKVKNKGWEFLVNYNDQFGDFDFGASLNSSIIRNEITDLYGTGPIIDGYTFKKVGRPINSLYGYVSEGIFQSESEVENHPNQGPNTAPGDLKYKDVNNDGEITTEDKEYLGNTFPKVTFGLNLTGEWKNFDLKLFLQGASGFKSYTDLGKIGSLTLKPTSIWKDSWTPENTSASMPRALYTQLQNDPGTKPSSFWVQNGSYIRLKNIQLGYNFPKKWMKKLGLDSARLYYSGQNLLTFSSLYDWVDPEAPNEDSIYFYPQVKINTVGLNISI